MDDATYAPQSPDLTSYYNTEPEPIHPQHQGYRGSISHAAPFTPFTPTEPSPFTTTKFGSQSYFPQQQPIPQQRQQFGGAPVFNQNIFHQKRDSNGAEDEEWDGSMAPSTRKKIKTQVKEEDGDMDNGHAAVEVRTKFPVARIKRIMQSDEDVGKVAQVTPVVVSKALELFMIDLVTSAATEAKARSSKRVTAAHLKQAVMSNEKYKDWLGDTVSRAPDAAATSASKASKDEDSDEWDGGPAKKKRGGGRRKKKEDD